ncbi:MAG: 30S ribosomal protein S11 [Trueperaceae bacterium]|nr:30S ribosomal protein S11 [Trueperaceae bacterium]
MAKNPKAPAKGRSARKRVRRTLTEGKAFIHASYNNTIVTITDVDGNPVTWSSSGSIGYKGSKKGTPYAAQLAAADATRKAQNMGLSHLDIVIRGTGSGREQAIRSIQSTGVNVRSIIDDTPVPHNGCRPRKRKRM